MQWGQIKTLFILCFLLLDVYLLFLYFEKERGADLSFLDRPDLSIEETLEGEEIIISDLPEEQPEEGFITVTQKLFTEEDEERLEGFGNQESEIVNDNFIISYFGEPIPLPDNATDENISRIVKGNVIYPEHYLLEYWDQENNVLVFFQQINDRPVYFNQNGLLLVFLNDDNEITSYTQTMLGDSEMSNDTNSLIRPIIAVETLYDNYHLFSGEEVTDMEFGYHTMLPLDYGVQVFVPTWRVTINNERNHFVNAVETIIFPNDEQSFMEEMLERSIERTRLIEEDVELREKMLTFLINLVEERNRSEEE